MREIESPSTTHKCLYAREEEPEHFTLSTVNSLHVASQHNEKVKVYLCKNCFRGYLSVEEEMLEEILGTIPVDNTELSYQLELIEWYEDTLKNWEN